MTWWSRKSRPRGRAVRSERRAPRRAAGFSFVEILFAIMLLAIGFILIAAMLPVAVVQTQETVDQTVAAQVAKGAAEAIEQVASSRIMPPTVDNLGDAWRPNAAPVKSFKDVQVRLGANSYDITLAWQSIKGKMIYATDPRYGWTAMYSREYLGTKINGSQAPSYAQVYVLITRVRNRDRYTMADLEGVRPNLRPRDVDILLTEGTVGTTVKPDIVEFLAPRMGDFSGIDTRAAVAEGTFIIISDDQQPSTYKPYPTYTGSAREARGLGNGRIYRVGNRRTDLDNKSQSGTQAWELMPGYDMPSGPGSGGPGDDGVMGTADDNQNMPVKKEKRPTPAHALIMGRASVDPADATQFDGPAQDVALFSTFVPLK